MYRIRFVLMMLKCLFSPVRELSEEFTMTFFAIPFLDTDFSRLFTHAYSSYMAIGRWNFVFSSKFRNAALKNGWAPVTTAETIEYRKSIKAFDLVEVRTRLLYWNENRFYLEQIFIVRKNIHAVCYVEGLVRSSRGAIEPPQAFRSMGLQALAPDIPPAIEKWVSSRSASLSIDKPSA